MCCSFLLHANGISFQAFLGDPSPKEPARGVATNRRFRGLPELIISLLPSDYSDPSTSPVSGFPGALSTGMPKFSLSGSLSQIFMLSLAMLALKTKWLITLPSPCLEPRSSGLGATALVVAGSNSQSSSLNLNWSLLPQNPPILRRLLGGGDRGRERRRWRRNSA